MTRLLCLLYLLTIFVNSVLAFDLESYFEKKSYRPVTAINCRVGENLCKNICKRDFRCEIRESFCRDCGSFDLFLEDIFTQVGIIYTSKMTPLNSSEIADYFTNRSFMGLTSKSIFNIYSGFDDQLLKMRFKELCPYGDTEYPILLVTLDESMIPDELTLVGCRQPWDHQWALFPINSSPELLVNPL